MPPSAPSMSELPLSEAQRRAIGIRLRAVLEASATLRRIGVQAERLDALEEAARETGALTGAPPPPPQPSLLGAMLAEILIAAEEIKPRHLRRYGDLDEQTAQQLKLLATRLITLTNALTAGADRSAAPTLMPADRDRAPKRPLALPATALDAVRRIARAGATALIAP